MSRRRPRRAAFTLIEVLLVLVILVILGSLVGVQMRGAQKRAQRSAAKIQVDNFDTPLGLYAQEMGNYPSTAAGLEALRTAPGEAQGGKWNGPYLDKAVPVDPWNHPYSYASPGRHNPDGYDVWSVGPDGVDGTDDDIGNWQ